MTTLIPYESALPNTSNSSLNEIPVGDRAPHTSTSETPEQSIPDKHQENKNGKMSAKIPTETWPTSSTPLKSSTPYQNRVENSSAQVLAGSPEPADEPSIISNFTEKSLSSTTLNPSSITSITNKNPSLNLDTIPIPSNSTTLTETHDYTKESLKLIGLIALSFAILFIIGLIPIIRKQIKERKQKKLNEIEFDEFQRSLEHSTDPVEINRNYRLKKYPIPAMRRSSSSIVSYSRHPQGLMIQPKPTNFSTTPTSLTWPPPVRRVNVQHQSFASDLSYPTTTYSMNIPIRYQLTDRI